MFLRNILRLQQKQKIQEFHTSFIDSAKLNADSKIYIGRQSSMLKKLMTGSNRSRSKFFTVQQTIPKQYEEIEFLDSKKKEKRSMSAKGKKRMSVLNTVFTQQITNLLSMGEGGTEILGLGLQISHVQLALDFSKISVYWQPTGTETDDLLEKLLPATAGRVRHRLCETRVMGMIPPITFVKDKFYDKAVKVDKALETCDFGPDFVPTDMSIRFKNMQHFPLPNSTAEKSVKMTSVLDTVSREVAAKEVQRGTEASSEEIVLNQSLDDIINGPVMRHDMLGLNHARIMEKIMYAVNHRKSKTESPTYIPEEVDGSSPSNLLDPNVLPRQEGDRSKEFITNMRKRYFEKKKMVKIENKALETELAETELLERLMAYQETLKDHSSEYVEDDDFIHEDEDELDSRPPY